MSHLSDRVETRAAVATTIAGTSTITGSIVDMQGYEGVKFAVQFGTAAADNTIKVQQGDAANMSDAADLEGSEVTLGGASDELVQSDLLHPIKRYVRMLVLRGTSSTIDAGWSDQYGPRKQPVDNNVVGTIATGTLSSPAEGTA